MDSSNEFEPVSSSYVNQANSISSKKLLEKYDLSSSELENLRTLRSQLMLRWFDRGNKTLVVASTRKEDGANELIAKLAVVLSQLNKKILFIDANLRQPTQHQFFEVESGLGLADILANREGHYELARQISLPNLTVLSAGTEAFNPQELLSQQGFAELLIDLEKIYDIILIDTSPLEVGSDVLAVASKVKAVVIVARKNFTMLADIQKLNQQINITGAEVIGCVYQGF